MDSEICIKVDDVSKDFILPHEKVTSVKSLLMSLPKRRSKSQKVQKALRNVSFEVKKGEFFGIVGRNGSGKSTLLKIIAGIYQPTKGQVTTRGKLVPFIELGVGFNPELTGRENVYLNGAMLGFSESEVTSMYDSIVEFAELERFMDQKLKNYSSGMQVRLAFSVAIRANADILIIDEVLAVGDAAFQRKCLNYFRQLKKDAKTVIFVSHDMDAVRQFCDRAALVEKSQIVTIDTSDRVADQYAQIFAREVEKQANKDGDKPKESSRWGSRLAYIENCNLIHRVINDSVPNLEFGGIIRFQEKVENPVIGFKIIDGAGRPILGTNSMLLKMNTGTHQPGTRLPFSWKAPNIFSNGTYTLGIGVITIDNDTLDIWNDALSFEVVKPFRTSYIVSPKVELKVGKPRKLSEAL